MPARSRCFFCYSLYLMACRVPAQGAYAARAPRPHLLSSSRFQRSRLVFCGVASDAPKCDASSPFLRSRIPPSPFALLATLLARCGHQRETRTFRTRAGALVRYLEHGIRDELPGALLLRTSMRLPWRDWAVV
ncbi:hypothetical protein L227DRAFT_210374 [Lentinus tigrinus ALCF2SS1-6]|uniref:Secreted protein n=1 Tax=Lentinus tigrinus ALCF2SS1-6 TaxID=1328759 RepID=A0A5C2SP42_9APHY|nr:hypothetical protein L227DRAFT_210374 [Lentinus tigrinus ALCF2SS1-6]